MLGDTGDQAVKPQSSDGVVERLQDAKHVKNGFATGKNAGRELFMLIRSA